MSAVAPAAAVPPQPGTVVARLRFADPEVAVRPMTAADAPFCRGLFDEERAAQFALLGLGESVLTTLLDQQYRAQQLGYQRTFPDADYAVIEHRGVTVGRLILALTPAWPSSAAVMNGQQAAESASPSAPRALHLVDIILMAAARGHGLGTAVIGGLECAAATLGAGRLTLSVLRTNVGARRLYQRLGFVAARGDGHIPMVKELR